MTKGTPTQVGMPDAVCHAKGELGVAAAGLFESVLSHISDALVSGAPVKTIQFARSDALDEALRSGRSPRTGQRHPIPTMRFLRFRLARKFRDRMAAAMRSLER